MFLASVCVFLATAITATDAAIPRSVGSAPTIRRFRMNAKCTAS